MLGAVPTVNLFLFDWVTAVGEFQPDGRYRPNVRIWGDGKA